MENRQIPVIAVAVFSTLLLLMFAFIVQPANAVTGSDFIIPALNNEVFYQESIDTYVMLQKNTVASASTKLCFLDAQSDSPSTETVCFTIFPQKDGCDVDTTDPINYNPCSSSVGSTDCDIDFPDSLACTNKTGLTGTFKGLWCGSTYCYVLFDLSTGSWSNQILRFWSLGVGSASTGDISGYRNFTANAIDMQDALWGFDECNPAPPNCGLGGITLYWSYANSTSLLIHLVKEGGTSLMGSVSTVSTVILFTSPIIDISGCRHCGEVATNTRVFISNGHNTGVSREAVLYNGATMTEIGSYSPTGISTSCTGSGVGGTATNNGLSEYMGDTVNRFAYTTDTGIIFIGSSTGALSASDCQVSADFSIVNYPRDIEIDEDNNLWYLWHGSTQSLASITQFNLTYASIDSEVDFDVDDVTISDTISGYIDGGQPFHSMGVGYNVNSILLATDSTKGRMLYLDGFTGELAEGDTEGSTNGICNNGTVLDCVGGAGSIGGLANLSPTYNITEIGTLLGQGVGLISEDNDNPKTNGIGLLYMLMMGVFFAGSLVYTIATLNSKGWVNMSVKEIDPLFWLFLVIGVVSASFYVGWIEDIIFYGMMVGLAGLVSVGILKQLGRI